MPMSMVRLNLATYVQVRSVVPDQLLLHMLVSWLGPLPDPHEPSRFEFRQPPLALRMSGNISDLTQASEESATKTAPLKVKFPQHLTEHSTLAAFQSTDVLVNILSASPDKALTDQIDRIF